MQLFLAATCGSKFPGMALVGSWWRVPHLVCWHAVYALVKIAPLGSGGQFHQLGSLQEFILHSRQLPASTSSRCGWPVLFSVCFNMATSMQRGQGLIL